MPDEDEKVVVHVPCFKGLPEEIRCQEQLFVDFLEKLLVIDPTKRFSAKQALEHEWLKTRRPALSLI